MTHRNHMGRPAMRQRCVCGSSEVRQIPAVMPAAQSPRRSSRICQILLQHGLEVEFVFALAIGPPNTWMPVTSTPTSLQPHRVFGPFPRAKTTSTAAELPIDCISIFRDPRWYGKWRSQVHGFHATDHRCGRRCVDEATVRMPFAQWRHHGVRSMLPSNASKRPALRSVVDSL